MGQRGAKVTTLHDATIEHSPFVSQQCQGSLLFAETLNRLWGTPDPLIKWEPPELFL